MLNLENCLLCLALVASIGVFQSGLTSVYAVGNDDSNAKEIGAWGIDNYSDNPSYPPPNDYLRYATEEAQGFYDKLMEKGFTPRFGYYNYSAWESDFEKQSVGGNDYIYADSCDFVYFAGHGWTDHFAFGGNHDRDGTYPFKAYSSFGSAEVDWGDQDMEWIFISASHSLEEFPYEWDPAFHSPITLHGIGGFHIGPGDTWESSHTGSYFVLFATEGGESIYSAWRDATIEWQESGYYGAMYSVYVVYPPPQPTVHYRNEHLPGVADGMYPDPPPPGGVSIYKEYTKWQC